MLGSGRRYWEGGRNIGQVDVGSLLSEKNIAFLFHSLISSLEVEGSGENAVPGAEVWL